MDQPSTVELLEPLIKQAEREGKWLLCSYQGITFSPKELREENAKGNFRWGPVNWRLFDPKTLLRDPEKARLEAVKHNDEIERRIKS